MLTFIRFLFQWAGPIRLLLAYLKVGYTERFYKLPVPHSSDQQDQPSNCQINEKLGDWNEEKKSSIFNFLT